VVAALAAPARAQAAGATVLAAPILSAPPANDDFADAQLLSGPRGSVEVDLTEATKEPGEPDHAGNPGGHSVWYRWIAPANGMVTLDTCESGLDTVLAVYGNGSWFYPYWEDDDGCAPGSLISESIAGGISIWIAVDGFDGAVGRTALHWSFRDVRPLNIGDPGLAGVAREGETLTATQGSWIGASAIGYAWQRCIDGSPVDVAHGRPTSSSHDFAADSSARAVDNDFDTIWNSGRFAPGWIEIDLVEAYPVERIRLAVAQYPDGPTRHAVYGREAGGSESYVFLGELAGSTADGQWLELPLSGVAELQSVLVETLESPSWVAWREIQVLSSCRPTGVAGPSYRLGLDDVGATIRAVVRASNAGGSTATATPRSAVIAAAAPVNVEAPLITGTPEAGLTLVASPGLWHGKKPISFAYQWQSCDAAAFSCRDILGATQAQILVRTFDIGSRLRVGVVATNSGGSRGHMSALTEVVRRQPVSRRCLVPRLRGKTLRSAKAALARRSCRLGAVRRAHSANVRRGRVVAQRPAAGKRLRAGTRVSVVVSKGRRR
jgi:PASTA domain